MRHTIQIVMMVVTAIIASACSTTSSLEEGEQLFTGLKKIEFTNHNSSEYFITTQEEIEAALATAPNGALFGSSYYRTPFPYGLWIWNAFSDNHSVFGKWMLSSFGKAPVLMSNINPELRIGVAENILHNQGYFRGKVDYSIIEGKARATKNDTTVIPRTAKIAYKVDMGPLFTIDTVGYRNFPEPLYNIITKEAGRIKNGDPFNVSTLDAERERIYHSLRDNGFYNFKASYVSFLADTIKHPTHVQLLVHLADSLPPQATRSYVIGKSLFKISRQYGEKLTDTITRRSLTVQYGGKRSPLRPRVLLNDLKLRPRKLFSQEDYEESLERLTQKGIFSSVDISFNERGNTLTDTESIKQVPDTIDMTVSCILDKPYDVALEGNLTSKTSGRFGPGIGLSFAKRNAFRGGEKLSLNLAANYEFQTGDNAGGDFSSNSYELSADLTLEMPRLLLPKSFIKRRYRWYNTPSTIIRISRETINRAEFFRRHILSADFGYNFQPTERSRHQFSPLILEYNRMPDSSEDYWQHVSSAYAKVAAEDIFISKMRYNYTFTSPLNYRNPLYVSATISEAGNITNAIYSVLGKGWDTKGKEMFKIPFSQFVKLDADITKTWLTGEHSSFLIHASAGAVITYGNSQITPFSEKYYLGGANDLRGFTARNVGPGPIHYADDKDKAFLFHNGDMKLVANFEYRPRLFGSLYGAMFVDMGNVWNFRSIDGEEALKDTHFSLKDLPKDLAVDAGIGIRYDLDFFVLRLDWAFALHSPYNTGKSGYFNPASFSKSQCINFAIGYPF